MIEGQRSEDHENYMVQATHALQAARANLRWNLNATNQLIYRSLPTTTRIHQFLNKRYGYEGAYINKTHPRKINSPWLIEHRNFLP
jgi:hypothetical protein